MNPCSFGQFFVEEDNILNQKQMLKEQKKRLQDYRDSNPDVMYVGNRSVVDLYFTISTMSKTNHTIPTLRIPRNTNLPYYHMLRRILSNFYFSVKHTITSLNGVRRSRMKPCGNDSVKRGR